MKKEIMFGLMVILLLPFISADVCDGGDIINLTQSNTTITCDTAVYFDTMTDGESWVHITQLMYAATGSVWFEVNITNSGGRYTTSDLPALTTVTADRVYDISSGIDPLNVTVRFPISDCDDINSIEFNSGNAGYTHAPSYTCVNNVLTIDLISLEDSTSNTITIDFTAATESKNYTMSAMTNVASFGAVLIMIVILIFVGSAAALIYLSLKGQSPIDSGGLDLKQIIWAVGIIVVSMLLIGAIALVFAKTNWNI